MNTLQLSDCITVTSVEEFSANMAKLYPLVIFDEFDYSIDNHMSSPNKSLEAMYGFFNSMLCKKVMLVSATYTTACGKTMNAMFKKIVRH